MYCLRPVIFLYHFLDAPAAMTRDQLAMVFDSAELDVDIHEKVLDFLLYYGVLGIRTDDHEYFIYTVNYDLRMLKIRGRRGKKDTRYVLNLAFWPTFDIDRGHRCSARACSGRLRNITPTDQLTSARRRTTKGLAALSADFPPTNADEGNCGAASIRRDPGHGNKSSVGRYRSPTGRLTRVCTRLPPARSRLPLEADG